MKNVWILNHYAVPPGASGGTRHFNLAKNLLAHGWQACIVAASVEHLSGKQRLTPKENARLEVHDGVPFLWLRTAGYFGNGGARMRNMLEYAWRVWRPSSTRVLPRPDVIIGSSVHPFAAVSGALLARRFGVPFIFEVRDLWPQTLIDLGRIAERSMAARMMRLLESWLYRRADRVVTLLPKAADYIVPLGVSADKVVWIPNGVDLSNFPDPGSRVTGANEPFTLMYFGAHGQANGLDSLLYAMKQLQDVPGSRPVVLRMIGDGPEKKVLRELAHRLKLENISFEPPVSKTEIPLIAAQADAFILAVLDKPELYKYGISMNKMYDYFAGRRPVLLASAATNNPIQDAMAGLTVSPEDPDALAEAVRRLLAMSPSELDRMGKAGRRYVEQHNDFKMLARKLALLLDECINSHETAANEFN